MDALANLGINSKLLLAQVVNFLILLFVLRRFAYRPMLEFLEKRTARIEQGLKDAESARATLTAAAREEQKLLDAARRDARDLLSRAEASAKERGEKRLSETEARSRRFLAEAETRIEEEKTRMISQAKKEIAETVALATEKILREKIDAGKDKEVIERILKKEV